MSASITRTVRMTVYSVEAQLLDTTTFKDVRPGYRYVNGQTVVKAHGEGEWCEWVADPNENWQPGDSVEVVSRLSATVRKVVA